MPFNDDEKKQVTLPATRTQYTDAPTPKPPALKRNDPYNPTFAPAATTPSGARVTWGVGQPYANDENRPVMTGTTTVPNAKPIPPRPAPVGNAPGTVPVTVPALRAAPSTTKKAPSQTMTDDQASQAEVAARTKAPPASQPNGVGAPTLAGGGSAQDEVIGTINGRSITRAQAGDLADKLPTIASNPAPVTLLNRGGRNVASTYGQSVLTMPDDNVVQGPQLNRSFRGPSEMAEQYNSREDREARLKAISDLDSEMFAFKLGAQRGDPAATRALAELSEQKSRLVAGGEQLSAAAVQGREARENTLANTGLEQAGANQRADQQAGLEQQDILLRRDAQAADQRGIKQTLTGEDGTVALLRNDGSTQGLTNPDGTPFRASGVDRGGLTPKDRLTYFRERISGLEEAIAQARSLNPQADVSTFQTQLDALNKQAEGVLSGGGQPTSSQVAALKANPDKAADFDALFGSGAAARILNTGK